MKQALALAVVEEDCMKGATEPKLNKYQELYELLTYKPKKKVEVILPNGKRELFWCTTHEKKQALKESIRFVASVEKREGKTVFWRFTTENIYRFGQDHVTLQNKNLIKQAFSKVKDFFYEEIYED